MIKLKKYTIRSPRKVHAEDLAQIQKFRPVDDDFMRVMFRDDLPLAQFVLRILTGIDDLVLTECKTQYDLKLFEAHSVCLDFFGKDSRQRLYDLQIQRRSDGASPKRARYDSSVLDIASLKKRQDYNCLPETYVIFITEHDIFKRDRPLYVFERRDDTGEKLNDGTHIIYANAAYRGETGSDAEKLLHDFMCSDPDDMLLPEMAKRTRYFKSTEEGVLSMCEYIENRVREAELRGERRGEKRGEKRGERRGEKRGEIRGEKRGEIRGAAEKARKLALNMLKSGRLDIKSISEISELSEAEIRDIAVKNGISVK